MVLVARHMAHRVRNGLGRVVEDVAPLDQLGVDAIGGQGRCESRR
jgi:hypothetical protein